MVKGWSGMDQEFSLVATVTSVRAPRERRAAQASRTLGANGRSANGSPWPPSRSTVQIGSATGVAIPSWAFLAKPALILAYGSEEFGAGALVTQILVGGVVLRALASGLGQILFASHQERTTLRIVFVNVVVAFALNVILIAQFGLPGAAVAVLLTRLISFLQHYAPVRRLLPELHLTAAAWRPITAAIVLAALLVLLRLRRH